MHCAQAFVAEFSSEEERSMSLGRLSLSYGLGMAIGCSQARAGRVNIRAHGPADDCPSVSPPLLPRDWAHAGPLRWSDHAPPDYPERQLPPAERLEGGGGGGGGRLTFPLLSRKANGRQPARRKRRRSPAEADREGPGGPEVPNADGETCGKLADR
eukprot:745905-Hanusia_phi.AAC.2